MKKLSIVMCAFALVSVFFTGCKEKKGTELSGLPNGFYVSVAGSDLVEVNAMDQGKNEVSQTDRAGMYEKYIVLEAGKTYEFVNKKGSNVERFGSALEYGDSIIITDNHEIAGYKGSLAANTTFSVKETALCHIVLDFNEDGSLTDVGGAQCIIVPVEWGVSGAMNSWGYTAATQDGNKFTWKDVTVSANGAFKFKHNEAWKINLDIANLVKANTNLGENCVVGGADIAIERAVYDIVLEFIGPAASTAESFKYTVTKVKDLEELDPTKFVYSFVGTATGSWDTDVDLAYKSVDNNHYVFEGTVDLAAGEFKIRRDHDWTVNFGFSNMTINGASVSDASGNVALAEAYKGTATFEFDWDGAAESNVTLTFGVAPTVNYVDGYFYVNAGSYIAAPNIYSWSDTKGNLYGNWPGNALVNKEGDNYKIAYHAVKDEAYKVIINGGDGQTVDSEAIVLTGQDVLVTVGGAKVGEKFAITVENKK